MSVTFGLRIRVHIMNIINMMLWKFAEYNFVDDVNMSKLQANAGQNNVHHSKKCFRCAV